ncbi:Oidioi.mRNA.OKI2018_I69.chr2.g5300.t1.cds [Oikopleura dioica]|uniref:Oidioi.mRNA.OKI2018_I69.chr2.g5300.t1.cds n=1 Tax=Oikopleura dioica TaxID=34765 RepID=A0ABN7T933_OIKDI|nr:Oidioi.mRNA.OKI2018_I69.chr2.g5300.t1.cds [Oikopleura dioica]
MILSYHLKLGKSIERTNHDSAQLELESFISLKTDELAQANSQQIIERYEGSLAKLFEQKDIKIDEFKNACSEHERAYQTKVEEQEDFFAAEISQICNLEEELLENLRNKKESPSNSPESEEQDVSWGRELEIRAAKKAEKTAKGAKKDGKHASLEKLPTFNFTAEDFEIHDSVPFSIIAEIGDEILTEESLHRAIKDGYLKKTFIQEIKQDFKLFVARFYEARKSTLSSEIEKSFSKREKILGKEIKMMKKFNSNRLGEIKSEISAVRIEQLKDHEKLLSLHEGNIKAEISNLISQSKELNKIAKKQLEKSKEIGPKLLEKIKETKFSRELKEIRKFFCSEFDKAEDDLKSIFTSFNEQMELTLSEVKRANTLFLKNYQPFSSGGCFSDFEKEEAEKRLIKLEKNLVRAMRNIGKEIEKNMPKKMREFEDLKKDSILNMENFEADLDFIARLDKEIRRIKIEVSGLMEDHKLSFNELDRNSTTLKMMDRAILSPTHEFPNVSLEQLQKQWKTVRESANKIVTSYRTRQNDESASELTEFYEKWLLEREKEKSPSPSMEQINRFGRRMSSLRTDNSARKALSNKISRGQQNTTETQTTGIVRRIIRDPKSQLKFNIFALDNPPEITDLPTKITSEMMGAADNALEIIDEFFKKKGPREVLFCKTPENLDKALCYLENSLEKIYSSGQKSLRAEFKRFEEISRSLEKIEGNLPSKIFNSCFSNFEKRMKSGQEEVRKRNEFLEDALEEAKKEHFNQLRVNLGHPDDLWKLEKINEEENDRVLRQSKFIKDKAEEEIEMLTEEISASLSQIYKETKFLSDSFSERILFDEIMEENPHIEKSTLRKLDCEHLPVFENEEIHVTKKTLAHLELEKERQLLYLKLKTFYTEKKLAVRNEEANALEDLHRWEGHFASHLADIKRLFSSST